MKQNTLIEQPNFDHMILRHKVLLFISFALSPVILSGLPTPIAYAEEAPFQNTLRNGLPGRRISQGNRCGCIDLPMAALIPETNLSKTIYPDPTIYVTAAPMSALHHSEFFLFNEEGTLLYTTSQPITAEGGLIGINLPSDILMLNESYRWIFSILANEASPPEIDSFISGWIRQVDIEAVRQEAASAQQNHRIEAQLSLLNTYQSADLWTDAIELGVDLRQQYPNDETVQLTWEQLIQTLNMPEDMGFQL